MNNNIKSNTAAAEELSTSVLNSLEGYLGFSLTPIYENANVAGSFDHDSLQIYIDSALSAWNDLVVCDANSIVDADAEFTNVDRLVAQGLLGIKCWS